MTLMTCPASGCGILTAKGWITVPWTQLPMVSAPFADFTWRYAREIVAARGQDDTDQAAVARVLDSLLARAGTALPAASPAGPPPRRRSRGCPALRPAPIRRPAEDEDEPQDTPVEPFGVFDPLNDDSGLW